MKTNEISTPAIVVDLDIMNNNLTRMAKYCDGSDISLRPHIKTHKTVEVAELQLELGAIGLTVAKVGEAEVMSNTNVKEILVAHPIIGDEKLRRLAKVAATRDVIVAVDSLPVAMSLSRMAGESGCSFGVLVEFDSGSRRCGVSAGQECAELGRVVCQLPNLEVRGVMTYFGSVWGDKKKRETELQRSAKEVAATINAFRSARLPITVVSAGSTPAAEMCHLIPGLTEIRPGTYVYNDLNTYYQGLCNLADCAVSVVTTVVSTAVPGRVIVDAGSKTFSSDALTAGPQEGYGQVMENEQATLSRLNEEHGFLRAPDLSQFYVGQVLTVIPNHVCTCINMHDEIFLSRSGEIVGSWTIGARGMVR